jgi:hypothetical protein
MVLLIGFMWVMACRAVFLFDREVYNLCLSHQFLIVCVATEAERSVRQFQEVHVSGAVGVVTFEALSFTEGPVPVLAPVKAGMTFLGDTGDLLNHVGQEAGLNGIRLMALTAVPGQILSGMGIEGTEFFRIGWGWLAIRADDLYPAGWGCIRGQRDTVSAFHEIEYELEIAVRYRYWIVLITCGVLNVYRYRLTACSLSYQTQGFSFRDYITHRENKAFSSGMRLKGNDNDRYECRRENRRYKSVFSHKNIYRVFLNTYRHIWERS